MPLSKSRFIQGISCPNKLYYALNRLVYANRDTTDPFLREIAKGGFQVEALAKAYFKDGIMNPHGSNEYESSFQFTACEFQKENAVLFEAGFLCDNLFALSDIVVKKGNTLQLIEVKAKSYTNLTDSPFLNKNGSIVSDWKPYLFDLAFQKELAIRCFPNLKIEAKLIMPDKAKKASINGLNQLICLPHGDKIDLRRDVKLKFNSVEELGDTLLGYPIGVDDIIEEIRNGKHLTDQGHTFLESIELLTELFHKPRYQTVNTKLSVCKSCPYHFDGSEESKKLKSGLEECMKDRFKLSDKEVKEPSVLDIWNFRKSDQLAGEGKFLMAQIEEVDLEIQSTPGKITRSERQWIQISKTNSGDTSPYFDYENLEVELKSWRFPLHFIDFETSSAALPFMQGMSPYESVLFQFSHHKMDKDGTIAHQTEYIHAIPGEFPNFEVVRKLKDALGSDQGTIFRFHNHENTILNAIRTQLKQSNEADKDELIAFLESITKPTNNSVDKWPVPERNMVDLAEIIRSYFYEPATKGSNSLKAYLPAILNSSEYLKNKYAQPIGSIGISSKNFPADWKWFESAEDGDGFDPYKRLPKLFQNWSLDELNKVNSEMEDLNNGGAAMVAYAVLQYQDISEEERRELNSALLKYCELDTLAMVMIYEGLKSLVLQMR